MRLAVQVLVWIVAFSVLMLTARAALDLAAHVARYRRYLRQYPATRSQRGNVWRFTR